MELDNTGMQERLGVGGGWAISAIVCWVRLCWVLGRRASSRGMGDRHCVQQQRADPGVPTE